MSTQLKDEVEADAVLDSTLYDFTWWSAQACGNRLPDLIQSFVSYQAQYSEELEHVQLVLAFLRSIDGQLPQIDSQLHLATYLLGAFNEKDSNGPKFNRLLRGARDVLKEKGVRSRLLPMRTFLTVHSALKVVYKGNIKSPNTTQTLIIGHRLVVCNAGKIELTKIDRAESFAVISTENPVLFPADDDEHMCLFYPKWNLLKVYGVVKVGVVKRVNLVPIENVEQTETTNDVKDTDEGVTGDEDHTDYLKCSFQKSASKNSIILWTERSSDNERKVHILTGLKHVLEPGNTSDDQIKLFQPTISDNAEERHYGFLDDNIAYYMTEHKHIHTFDLNNNKGKFEPPVLWSAEAVGPISDSKMAAIVYVEGAWRLLIDTRIEDINVKSVSHTIMTTPKGHNNGVYGARVCGSERGLSFVIADHVLYWVRVTSDGTFISSGQLQLHESICYLLPEEFTFEGNNYLFIKGEPAICISLSTVEPELTGNLPVFSSKTIFGKHYFGHYSEKSTQIEVKVYDFKEIVTSKSLKSESEKSRDLFKQSFTYRHSETFWCCNKQRQIFYFVDHDFMDIAMTEIGNNGIKFRKDIKLEPMRNSRSAVTRISNDGNLLYISLDGDLVQYDWQNEKSEKVVALNEFGDFGPQYFSEGENSWFAIPVLDSSKVVKVDLSKRTVQLFHIDNKVTVNPYSHILVTKASFLIVTHSELSVLKYDDNGLQLRHTIKGVQKTASCQKYFAYLLKENKAAQSVTRSTSKLVIANPQTGKTLKQLFIPKCNEQSDQELRVEQFQFVGGNAQLIVHCVNQENSVLLNTLYSTIVLYDLENRDEGGEFVLPSAVVQMNDEICTLSVCGLCHSFGARLQSKQLAVFQVIGRAEQAEKEGSAIELNSHEH